MDEQALIDAIFARPDEDDTAQVYADWLEEHGQADRARLIRVEMELERSSARGEGRERLLAEREELQPACVAALPASPGLRKKVLFSFHRGLASVAPNPGVTLTSANLRELAGIACLKTLSALDRLSPEGLAQLSLCPNVQELRYGGYQAGDLTPEHWQAIAGLQHVERFHGDGYSDEFDDEVALHLSALSQLKAVELKYATVSDVGVGHLAREGLEVLRLPFGGEPEGGGISDASAETLSSLRRLRELDLAGSRLTDAGLAHLAALKELTHLDVSRTAVKKPMPVFVQMKKLRYLGLEGMRIGDGDLKELAKRLPALRGMDLRGTSVTRFRLAQLLPKTKWKRLHLEAAMGMGRSEEKEVEAFAEFCRDRDVFVEVDWE